MMVRRAAILLPSLAVLALGLAACGDDEDDVGSSSGSATASEAVDDTTTTAAVTDGGIDGPDAEAIAAAVGTVFDTAVGFDEKVALLEGGESLRAAHEAYVLGAEQVGGIAVEATAVTVEGDSAEVTYRVLFAGNETYRDLTMAVGRIDGAWVVPTEDFCGFLAAARTPC